MKKLTKKEIAEGIQSVPIERIILGANSKNGIKLTKKQKEFAEQVVATGNKTEAYKRAYNTNGKRTTASPQANKLSKNANIATYINALNAQKEVEEYLLPTRLRALAIHKLSNMALNDELPPAQQLKALELVGKMTEVALFSERREIVHTLDSNTLKAKLMDAVQLAIKNSKTIQARTKKTAQELLAELSADAIDVESNDVTMRNDATSIQEVDSISKMDGDGVEKPLLDDATRGDAPIFQSHDGEHLHSIPHNESPTHNESPLETQHMQLHMLQAVDLNKENLKNVEGVPMQRTDWVEKSAFSQTPPITNWVEKG